MLIECISVMSNLAQNSKMLQNLTHFFKTFTSDFLCTSVTLQEPVKLGVRICSMVDRLTWYDSSEPNSAIVFADETVSAYNLTSVIVKLSIRSTCCPVLPENNIIFKTEVRWTGSPTIQTLLTHYITRMFQLKLPMIRVMLDCIL